MRSIQNLLAALAVSGMLLPATRSAAQPWPGTSVHEPPGSKVRDVTLDAQGLFHARVLSPDGHPVVSQSSTLQRQGHDLVTWPTSSDGTLQFRGLPGGLYSLKVADQVTYVRVWTAAAAPPSAVAELLVVHGGVVQRAQQPFCNLFGQEPVMIGLLIAAAIAIPIAVHNSGSDAPNGS